MQLSDVYKVFIDDERLPQQCLTFMEDLEYADAWIIVRTYREFVEIVRNNYQVHGILPKVISFDHDLGFTHEGDEQVERSGLDCAKFMVDFCATKKLPFPRYKVHSRNVVGRENIIAQIEFYKKHYKNEKQNS